MREGESLARPEKSRWAAHGWRPLCKSARAATVNKQDGQIGFKASACIIARFKTNPVKTTQTYRPAIVLSQWPLSLVSRKAS